MTTGPAEPSPAEPSPAEPSPVEPSPVEVARSRDRRAARNAVKLRALVESRWGAAGEAASLGTGAALVASDDEGAGAAHVLLDGGHGLGAALAWARRHDADRLHVIVDEPASTPGSPGPVLTAGDVARQAEAFATPVHVYRSSGRTLQEAAPTPVPTGVGPPDAPELVALLESLGLDVVVEGERLAAEFRGLEVARVVRALDDGAPLLEVGVGRYDRTLTAMMHGDLDDRAAIERVVEQLRAIRGPGGPPNHPLATLVPERWLRSTLLVEPGMIGCDRLHAAPGPQVRDSLRPRGVAIAVGTRQGAPVVVGCSVGVDLDAVVVAADARAMIDPEATLLVAVPARDALPVMRVMVEDLIRPAELALVEGDWRR